MTPDRRQLLTLTGGAALGTATAIAGATTATAKGSQQPAKLSVTEFGIVPSSNSDQTREIQAAIDETSRRSQSLYFPAGNYIVKQLKLGAFAHLTGEGHSTRLIASGPGTLIATSSSKDITLRSIGFFRAESKDGKPKKPLITLQNIQNFLFCSCYIENSFADGLKIEKCRGKILDNTFVNNAGAALICEDSQSVDISHNSIRDCGGGIVIRRRQRGEDGTSITSNRIERIKANSKSGVTGIGIDLFRAHSVIISGNLVTDCGHSAINASEVSNIQLIGNSCLRLLGYGIKFDSDFESVIVANNLIEETSTGISLSNRKGGGRLSIIQGNIVRNLNKLKSQHGVGIAVESDCAVNSNILENIPFAGILLGWGKHLRDATASNNVIRNAGIGIGVSTDNEAGYATIMNNMISGAKKGAIRAMDLEKPIGPDLSQQSAESFRNIAAFGNVSL